MFSSGRSDAPTASQADEPVVLSLTRRKRTAVFLRVYWRSIILIAWPLCLLPFLLTYNTKAARCGYVILVMAVFWMTEVVPLAVTSLIPIVLFPALGILDSRQTCSCYMNDTIMVFVGGLILAVAIEHSNLHMRIALVVMRFVGCSHGKLLGGLCTVTAFTSMWVSNTATCAMMIPIIFAVLEELEKEGFSRVFDETPSDPEDPNSAPILKPTKTTKAYLLAVAYSSTFGGTGTLVGTGTNLTLKGIYEQTFPDPQGIGFTQWATWAMPLMMLNVFLTWVYVQMFYLGLFRPKSRDAIETAIGHQGESVADQVIKEKYENLGRMSFHEAAVGVLFLLCAFLWVFRHPGFIPGWADVIANTNIQDSAPVILVAILFFFIPKSPTFLKACSQHASERPTRASDGLITWKVINSKMPWDLMFLLGGGFAISRGSDQSCLSKRIGEFLTPLRKLPSFVILLIVCLFIGTTTEVTSNIGIANIMLPVVAQMCIAIQQHPLYLMIPATMCCSHAFRFPVGTPPNAIVAAAGHIPTKSMLIGGCPPAMYSFLTLMILFPTWGVYVYNIGEFPEWAAVLHNSTAKNHCD